MNTVDFSNSIRGRFPIFIPQTEEMNIQECPRLLKEYAGEEFYITEKLKGYSITMFWFENNDMPGRAAEFHVCSHDFDLIDDGNIFWNTAKEMDFLKKLASCMYGIALQGVIVGEGIKGNPYNIEGRKIYVFNAYDFIKGEYLDFSMFSKLIDHIKVESVPVVNHYYLLPPTVDEIVSHTRIKSQLSSNKLVEGCVFRPRYEITDGGIGRVSFQVLNQKK